MSNATIAAGHCPECGALFRPDAIACRKCGSTQALLPSDLRLPFWTRSDWHKAAVACLAVGLVLSSWLTLAGRQPATLRAVWLLADIFWAGALATCFSARRRSLFFMIGLLVAVVLLRVVTLLVAFPIT
jgi:hypothetical protein